MNACDSGIEMAQKTPPAREVNRSERMERAKARARRRGCEPNVIKMKIRMRSDNVSLAEQRYDNENVVDPWDEETAWRGWKWSGWKFPH
jgi:hypothetical protein